MTAHMDKILSQKSKKTIINVSLFVMHNMTGVYINNPT